MSGAGAGEGVCSEVLPAEMMVTAGRAGSVLTMARDTLSLR